MKFGGSSVASIDKMRNIADKVMKRVAEGCEVVVVVSAMGKTTNQLLELAAEASKNPSKREIDLLISTGEQVSISLLTMIFKDKGQDAIALTGFQAGIKTTGVHTKNTIEDIHTEKIEAELALGKVAVVAGFQGINSDGDITTLGRGGSDTSAVALAAKLGCHAEIYTDVEGIYGVDPRIYPAAKKMDEVSYEEMKEMAFLGAKVMEPRSIEIGERYGVEIYVASTHSDAKGTWIKKGQDMETKSISGVSISDNVMVVAMKHLPNNHKTVAEIFVKLAKAGVNVDMISQTFSSENLINLSYTVSTDDLATIEQVISEAETSYPESLCYIKKDVIKVSVVGEGMRTQTGVAAQLFDLLANNEIPFRLVTTSEISISFTINQELKEQAVHVIASHFEL